MATTSAESRGAVEGAEEGRVRVRRPDHDVRADGGRRRLRPPPRRLLPPAAARPIASGRMSDRHAASARSPTTPSATSTRWASSRRSRAATVGVAEVVEAAIARVRAVDGRRSARWRTPPSTAPASRPATRGAGSSPGVPTVVKDNCDVAGHADPQGTDAWVAARPRADGDFARMYLATGLVPLGKSQLSEFGFSAAPSTRAWGRCASPWYARPPRRRVVGRLGRARRRGRAADRPRQRRRRLDPDPGGRQRPGRAQADPRAGWRRTRSCARCRCASSPTASLTRSVRDTAAFLREAEHVYRTLSLPPGRRHHPPGPQAAAGRASTPPAPGSTPTPEVADADPADRRAARGARPPASRRSRRRCPTASATTSCSTGRCSRWSWCAPDGASTAARWDPTRLDHLTQGLARHAAAQPAPAARRGPPAAALDGALGAASTRRTTSC